MISGYKIESGKRVHLLQLEESPIQAEGSKRYAS
jgi:hypothetical protein